MVINGVTGVSHDLSLFTGDNFGEYIEIEVLSIFPIKKEKPRPAYSVRL
jgi:hypothetical protein